MQVIEGLVMPDGWHFMQLMPNGTYCRVDAGSYPELLDAVLRFRLENRLPIGEVQKDTDSYICDKYPHQCAMGARPVYHNVNSVAGQIGNRFIDRITQWANGMHSRGENKTLETMEEASRRGKICLQCPLNIEWKNACAPCVTNAQRVLTFIRQNKDVIEWRKLLACKAGKHCNRTAIWIKKEVLGTVDGVTSECWLK